MKSYSDFIRNIKPFEYNKYASVSSREKLVVYAIKYLNDHEIPSSWNYICLAAYKLFPEKFYFSEEFKEYPHIEMLNRTILHLRPKERNLASGSTRINYQLTKFGEETAKQVDIEINGNKKTKIAKKLMDEHKNPPESDLKKIKSSELFKEWCLKNDVDEMAIWKYFDVTPYSQIKKIKKDIKEMKRYAKEKKENSVVGLLENIEKKIF